MAVVTQHASNGSAARRRLPDATRKPLDLQQRLHRYRGSFVQVETPLDVGVALYLTRVIKHEAI
jgi:hypothetical protein